MSIASATGGTAETFDVFGYSFGFDSSCLSARRRIRSLYDRFATPAGENGGPTFSLNRERASERPAWNVRLDNQLVASESTLGMGLRSAEYEISRRIATHRSEVLTLHAATVCAPHGTALISGPSGSGKSTLALALASRGYHVASDDVTLLSPGDPPAICPLPRCLGLDSRSRRLLRRIGLKLPRGPHGVLTHADLDARSIRASGVRVIVILDRPGERAAGPLLRPVVQAEMVGELISQVAWADSREAQALETLGRLTGPAACYRLRRGPIEQMCDVLARSLDAT